MQPTDYGLKLLNPEARKKRSFFFNNLTISCIVFVIIKGNFLTGDQTLLCHPLNTHCVLVPQLIL